MPEFGPNDWFVEEKYQEFLADPASVDPTWRRYFADGGPAAAVATAPPAAAPHATPRPSRPPAPRASDRRA
jgi:2-oxoglutarate dehydrogenase complex dehydrogenase (E1) component-like enzyme